ncbi:MAG: helix-turn-helix domain-containing protein [Candidatus Margulisiibacteriota bacterium]
MESLRALDQLRMQGHRSAYLEIGTGGGKTRIAVQDALSFIQKNKGARVLWVSHRGELLDQAEEAFFDMAPETRILRNIRDHRGRPISFEDCDVLIVSKQTLENNLRQFPRAAFQYVVIDEAHHAYAEGYQSILQHLVPAFTLGITATPRRFTDRKHIRDLFGPCALKMNLLELVRAGILIEKIKFRKVETNVELEAKLADSGEFNLPHFWNQIKDTARNEVVADTYLELEAGKRGKSALTFCVSVEHAEAMAELYRTKGIKAEALHGKLSPTDRARMLSEFESGQLSMLTCVDILNEGYDFPPIEVILMARPTRSKTVWLQQVGRGTRKSPSTGKENLLIIDFVDNLGAVRQQITFEEIFKPLGTGTPRPAATPVEKEGMEEVSIENIIDMDLDEVFDVVPLQPNELTTNMLARRIGLLPVTVTGAVRDGRLKAFVRRTIRRGGNEASIFLEDDIGKIIDILHPVHLQPNELTTAMLEKRIGISRNIICTAINDGRIKAYVRRTVKYSNGESAVFHEEDIDKIQSVLQADHAPLQPHELTTTMLAGRIKIDPPTIRRAILDGRIRAFVRRTTKNFKGRASLFHEEDVDKIRKILCVDHVPLQSHELTTTMLAKRIGVSHGTILNAVKDGRIQGYVKRKFVMGRREASVFSEEDAEKIRALLQPDQFHPQPNELTIGKLAEIIGVSIKAIHTAINDGRIKAYVIRTIKHSRGRAVVFRKEDIEEIRKILRVDQVPLQAHELTMNTLAKRIGVSPSTIHNARRDGRIAAFVKRTIVAGKETKIYIFDEKDIDNVRTILLADESPLQPNELTTVALAKLMGVSMRKIWNAINDGRIMPFIKRTIRATRGRASIFSVDDVVKMQEILHADQVALQPQELTAGMLAKRIGVCKTSIRNALRDGRLNGFIRRVLIIKDKKASIFQESDIEEIKRIFGR